MATNLPLTVDFPLLVRNLLEELVGLPAPSRPDWAIVGRPVALSGHGEVLRVTDPNGEVLPAQGTLFFLPRTPGIHTVTTDRGTYLLAVNVDPMESSPARPLVAGPVAQEPEGLEAQVVLPIWPLFAGAGILLLLVEAARYHGMALRRIR